jgi:hypothetical protein
LNWKKKSALILTTCFSLLAIGGYLSILAFDYAMRGIHDALPFWAGLGLIFSVFLVGGIMQAGIKAEY